MHTTLYTVSIPPMRRVLVSLGKTLEKAAVYAESKKTPRMTFEAALLNDRLVFDQFELKRQVQVACDNAKGAAARLAEIENPKFEDTEETFSELCARVQKTIAFLDSIQPEQIAGKEGVSITLPYFPDKTFTGLDYLTAYALPNFYFHVTTAYSILRKNGVPVGKSDYIGELPFSS